MATYKYYPPSNNNRLYRVFDPITGIYLDGRYTIEKCVFEISDVSQKLTYTLKRSNNTVTSYQPYVIYGTDDNTPSNPTNNDWSDDASGFTDPSGDGNPLSISSFDSDWSTHFSEFIPKYNIGSTVYVLPHHLMNTPGIYPSDMNPLAILEGKVNKIKATFTNLQPEIKYEVETTNSNDIKSTSVMDFPTTNFMIGKHEYFESEIFESEYYAKNKLNNILQSN